MDATKMWASAHTHLPLILLNQVHLGLCFYSNHTFRAVETFSLKRGIEEYSFLPPVFILSTSPKCTETFFQCLFKY